MSSRRDRREYNRKWYQKDLEKNREYGRVYSQNLKKVILDYYGNQCVCCKENGKTFLQIDHVNDDGYMDRNPGGSRRTGAAFYSKIIKLNFPPTFQILCANCNFSKKLNKGKCEHKLNHER